MKKRIMYFIGAFLAFVFSNQNCFSATLYGSPRAYDDTMVQQPKNIFLDKFNYVVFLPLFLILLVLVTLFIFLMKRRRREIESNFKNKK